MYGSDCLWHGAHADHVGAKIAQHAIFGLGFEVWAKYASVNGLVQMDLLTQRDFIGQGQQLAVVGIEHVRPTWADAIIIWAD